MTQSAQPVTPRRGPRPAARSASWAVRAVQVAGGTAGAALAVWLVYLGLTWDLRPASSATAPARVAAVVRGDLRESVVATGVLEPVSRVTIQSEVPGIVATVGIEEGERVHKGDPIVILDRARIEDLVAELRADLAEKRNLASQRLHARAAAELAQARVDDERTRRLLAEGVVSQKHADASRLELELAGLAARNARAEEAARAAAVDGAEAALRRAERDLERLVIRSPIDGVVVARNVNVGSAVADIQNGGTVIAVLADDSAIHLLADVDEHDVARTREGNEVIVSVDSLPGEELRGKITRISSSGTRRQSVSDFQIEVEITADPRIRVGMSADARILVTEHRGVLLVPAGAILRTAAGPIVRLASGTEERERVVVREGPTDGKNVVILDGVAEGDEILIGPDGSGR